jgi:hypothetical protein
MSILDSAQDWLDKTREAHLAVEVEYRPNEGQWKKIKATCGKTTFKYTNEYGIGVRTSSRDFIVSVKEYPNEPQKGDIILYKDIFYEVLAPNNEPVWKWVGRNFTTRRIHTKEI